ncbi:hypothetical protein VE00_09360 [Pseudogymnoascus sp. WSF 3629]|nr:hypothetical protein VE00_09360 [Pseudogymnoascus sp. WSF 3629]
MNTSALDSRVFRNLFGTQEIREVFSDEAYVSCMIDAETALSRAQSVLGVIPAEAGESITQCCDVKKINFERLANETDIVGYPVLPLVNQLVEMCPKGDFIHWGATTQDIMDIASMLQMRKGLQIVRKQLAELIQTLTKLSHTYRDTLMPGRTHLQHALPVTFGYKCAVYLSSIQRHYARLDELEPRCLLVQLGGAAGTLASLGNDNTGVRVRKQLAQELQLNDPDITWHVARDGVAEIANFLALIGGSLGKIALDIIIMSSNEIGEVSEPFVPHRGASSTMPQKRNPISSEVILAASKILRSNAGLVLDGMVSDFERASGPWHLEWVAIPESFIIASGALHQTIFAMSGLVVNADAMLTNLHSTRGLIVAEAVMMGLAPFVGRNPAHELVYEACKTSIETSEGLIDILMKSEEIISKIDEKHLRNLCDPAQYLGSATIMTDAVINRRGAWGTVAVNGQLINGTNGVKGMNSANGKITNKVNGANGTNGVH